MKLLMNIQNGIKAAWSYKRLIVILYLLTFVLAAAVAYPLQQLLKSTVGNSLIIANLIKGFDYTFLNDFNNAHGAAFVPIIQQSIVTVGLFVLLMVFLTGGIVSTFVQQKDAYDGEFFWSKNAIFFWRILRVTIVFGILHLIVFGLIWSFFYNAVSGFSPFDLETEETVSFAFKMILPIYIIVAAFFFLWQDYTKIILVKTNQNWVIRAMWQSFRFILQNFFKVYGLYFLLGLLWLILIWVNYLISTVIKIDSSNTIWLSFLVSQCFVFGRYFLKMTTVGTLVDYYQNQNQE